MDDFNLEYTTNADSIALQLTDHLTYDQMIWLVLRVVAIIGDSDFTHALLRAIAKEA